MLHKTWAGKTLATIAGAIHKFLSGSEPITLASIEHNAPDIVKTINVVQEIGKDVKAAGSDPAAIANALSESIIKHLPELPASLQTDEAITELATLCHQELGLPVDQIEAAIKLELGKK